MVKNFLLNLLLVFLSIITILIFLEIILRVFSLSSTPSLTQTLNSENKVLHFKPNHTFKHIQGWNGYIKVNHRTNNYGYNTKFDFNTNDKVNCVIGDSFVEALQVHTDSSFHGIINNKGYKIYPIGMSGSSLSDYIHFHIFANNNFKCAKYIFVIIENDFEQSFQTIPSHYYFTQNNKLKFIPYNVSKLKKFLRNFALANYIYKNLKITDLSFLNSIFFNKNKFTKLNDSAIESFDISKLAIDYFFQHIESNNINMNDILFIIDGDRKSIYKNKNIDVKLQKTFKYFIQKSISYDIKFIDLHLIFQNDFKKNNKIFNFDRDYHWNEYAHSIVAKEIINSNFLIFD